MVHNIFLAFIPIFVAVDALGVLPIFVNLTFHLKEREKRIIIAQSLLTAIILAIAFIFLGKAVFRLLGITVGDFMIGGGAVLFCIAMIDLMNSEKKRRIPPKDLGAVPLGTPLIVGPAVLTTSLMIIPSYGIVATIISILINVLLAGLIFIFSDKLIKVLGSAGTKALSKITSLFLIAIAVMMIRKGVLFFIS